MHVGCGASCGDHDSRVSTCAGDDTGLAVQQTVLIGGCFGQILIVGLMAVALSRLSSRGSSPTTGSRKISIRDKKAANGPEDAHARASGRRTRPIQHAPGDPRSHPSHDFVLRCCRAVDVRQSGVGAGAWRGTTYTSSRPDSSDVNATHRPFGENFPFCSLAEACKNGRGARSPDIGKLQISVPVSDRLRPV
jgi:hypothetical protein